MKRLLSIAVVLATSFASEGAASFVDGLHAGRPQKIVCYGTSLTAQSNYWVDGLRAALEARWPGKATVVNAGLSGKNSATGLANVQSKVVAEHPDAVLLEFSMNDAADSLNGSKTTEQALADAESNLKAIIAAVRADNPNCEVILETMNPYMGVAGSSLSNRTDLDAHVAMYRRVAKEEGYLLIDTYPKWQEVLAKGSSEYLKLVPDGVHPNALGCRTVTLPNVMRTLGVDGGTVNISPSVLTVTNGPVRVTDGGFEPKAALPTNDRNAQDKRSVRDAGWLADNLPGWTFGPSDNNGSGICNNGSYFSNGSQLTKLLPGNKHCAFLRIDPTKNPSVGPGRISQKFFAPLAGTPFLFSCRLAQRYYDGNTWSGKVALKVDGREVAVSDLVQTWSVWQVFSVNFAVESAGMHELSLEAVANASGVCDVLVDEVTLGYAYERAITSTEPLAGLSLDLAEGTVLNLDAALAATMGGIRYDGERILGIVSAETYPSFVVGEGFVRTFGRFHITIQ